MARGEDTSRNPGRDLSRQSEASKRGVAGPERPNASTRMRISREDRSQHYLFGVTLGPQDSGERLGADRPGQKPNQNRAPVGGLLEGQPADVIRLAQMKANKEHAMAALMQHPPSGGGASKMVDVGMSGRLSAGKFPVHSYRDERIMLKPEGSEERASQFHGAHESAHDNVPHPDQD